MLDELFTNTEQNQLKIIINSQTETPSIWTRIFSVITTPLSWIATSIENLAWRLIDPTWRVFVIKSQGHLVYTKYQNTFNPAITKMDQIFTTTIRNSNSSKEWHSIHEKIKSNRDQTQLWIQFSREYGGTCFGNCISLANVILNAKRPLTINELKKIENTEIFIETAQAIQLVANSAIEYNKKIVMNGLLELKKKLI
jgi:hypothetical protein